MIRCEIDPKSDFVVRWFTTDEDTIQAGKAFIAYEDTLPGDQQSPLLSRIRSTTDAAGSSASSATSGETSRAVSAEDLRAARDGAKQPLRLALNALKLEFADNPAVLEAYGLHTKQGKSGVIVYTPKNPSDWDRFLVAYVEKQSALDPSARIQKPALETLSPLAATVSAAMQNREQGRTQRELGVSSRLEATAQLHDLLEVAACYLVATRFNFKVTRDLQLWGFDVVQAKPSSSEQPVEDNTEPTAE